MKSRALHQALSGLALTAVAAAGHAAILAEDFDSVASLAGAGWVQTNSSSPLGTTGWFQGNDGVFASQSGAADSYVAANFLNAADTGGAVDNWLISPELALTGGAKLTFYTRTADPGFGDLLEVRFSTGSAADTASFTSLLLTVGDLQTPYPDSDWSSFSVVLPSVISGRFAFRYAVADSINADYIGIDSVHVDAVPEPATWALLGCGMAALALRRRAAAKV